jgi:hypothetical protein
MSRIPKAIEKLFTEFSKEFSPSVWERFLQLLIASVLLRGRKTIWRLLQSSGIPLLGHFSSYHRVFSHRRWSGFALSRHFSRALVERLAPIGVLQLAGDDTVSQHRGEKVYGKGCHRDAVRSSHNHLVHRWGHKWVVLSLRVHVPGAKRTWALPVLVALYRTPAESKRLGLRHKTPPELMQGLLSVWLRWFPNRKSVFSGDGGFATHRLSQFASRHSRQLTLVSKLVPTAVLHEAASPRTKNQKGRPRVVGARLPSPKQVVACRSRGRIVNVSWYGGGRRRVSVISGEGHWYRQGHGLVRIRWVHVLDLDGNHREEYFYSTDCKMDVTEIIEAFVGRWDIEVTFEEMREHMGLETSRGRTCNTVLRFEPCQFLLYSLVVYWYLEIAPSSQNAIWYSWHGKTSITYTDVIIAVRRNAWDQHLFQRSTPRGFVVKLPNAAKKLVLDALALAT